MNYLMILGGKKNALRGELSSNLFHFVYYIKFLTRLGDFYEGFIWN